MVLKNQPGSTSCQQKESGSWESNQERGKMKLAPPTPPAPGITKAAAVAETRNSGTVQVFLRWWARPRSSETGVEKRGQASTRTCALGRLKRPRTKTKGNLTPTPARPGTQSTLHKRPGGEAAGAGAEGTAGMLGDCWLRHVGGLEGECPME